MQGLFLGNGGGGSCISLGMHSFHYNAEFGQLRTLRVERSPSEARCAQMLEFIRANPTQTVEYFVQCCMPDDQCPTMAAIHELINPTLEFSSQDFLYVTNPATPIASLASASVAISVCGMKQHRHVRALIAALPTFKARLIRFCDCDFRGYTKALFAALAKSPIHTIWCEEVYCVHRVRFDEECIRSVNDQFQLRVGVFALLHGRRRGVALRRLPVEMYRMVGQML